MERVYNFWKQANTYYLSTIDNNKPKVRPFGTINIFENKLYIQTGKIKDVSKQIKANPNVEICAFMDGQWLRLYGELILDSRVEAKKSMLDAYPNLRHMYDEKDNNTEVFYFKTATACFYSFTSNPEIYKIC